MRGGFERTPSSWRWTARRWGPVLALAGVTSVSAAALPARGDGKPSPEGSPRIALFPVANLSGILTDVRLVESALRARLSAAGVRLAAPEEIDAVFDRHRVRYVAGVDRFVARWLREEARIDSILLCSVDLSDDGRLPRVALTARLVTAEDDPTILWMDSFSLAGDDSPGVFDLGLIRDPAILAEDGVARLVASLGPVLNGDAGRGPRRRSARRYRPRTLYVAPGTGVARTVEKPIRVAVVPFTNQSGRRQAGEILQLQLVRALVAETATEVLEPGVVRQFLLDRRIIPARGVSLSQGDAFREALDVDWVISGNVFGFDDGAARGLPPARVSFSVTAIDTRQRLVVATAFSGAGGSDGLILFGHGRVRSAAGVAGRLATALVRRVVRRSGRKAKPSPPIATAP